MVTVPLPSRLFSLWWTRKDLHHLRACYNRATHHMQLSIGQLTVQHLVCAMTYTLLVMPIGILIHTLILAALTLLRMELLTVLQSWLEARTFHLTRLRYFISLESRCLFYSHARKNHQNSKKNYSPKKSLLIKTNCKAESIGSQRFDYFMCLIHGFILLFKLNGTHVPVRWSGTRSEAVSASNVLVFSRYPGHQKQIYFNLVITDLPGFFYSFWCENGAKHRSTTRRRPVCDLCLHLFYICASTHGVFESCLPVHT